MHATFDYLPEWPAYSEIPRYNYLPSIELTFVQTTTVNSVYDNYMIWSFECTEDVWFTLLAYYDYLNSIQS